MRIVSGKQTPEDGGLDTTLRPRRLEHFIGQQKIKDNLRISLVACQRREEPLDHIVFYGPPGLGKTTLAYIVAAEMGANIKVTSGPAIERPGDLAALLTNLQKGDVLFIDEIHRLNRVAEEILYPAMEDFALDIVLGKGPGVRSLRLNVPHFTLVGATTRFALLSPPLRDRFGATYHVEFYDEPAMQKILERSAAILGVKADKDGVRQIAGRSRGTPRVANRLLKRVRDYAEVEAEGRITEKVALEALGKLEIDGLGLDAMDRRVMKTIIDKFNGGPVGLDTLAAAVNEEPDTIMDVYEPYLLQLGFLERTPRGRLVTRLGCEHLGIAFPKTIQSAML